MITAIPLSTPGAYITEGKGKRTNERKIYETISKIKLSQSTEKDDSFK